MTSELFLEKITPLINCGADCNDLQDFADYILPMIEYQEEIIKELLEALRDEVKSCYNDTESFSKKSMNILEKHYNKSWEEIIK